MTLDNGQGCRAAAATAGGNGTPKFGSEESMLIGRFIPLVFLAVPFPKRGKNSMGPTLIII